MSEIQETSTTRQNQIGFALFEVSNRLGLDRVSREHVGILVFALIGTGLIIWGSVNHGDAILSNAGQAINLLVHEILVY